MPKPYKKNVSFQIEADLLRQAKMWAERERRSLAQFMNVCVESRIAMLEEDNLRQSQQHLERTPHGYETRLG